MTTATLPDIDLEELLGHVITCKKCSSEAEWVLVKPCRCDEPHGLLCDPCLSKLVMLHAGDPPPNRWVCTCCHGVISTSPHVRDLFRRL